MLHRNINELNSLGREIMYIDELTGETISGIVLRVEQLSDTVAFVYVASPYKDENDKTEGNMKYKDIIVFDNIPNTVHGWHRNVVDGNYHSTFNK